MSRRQQQMKRELIGLVVGAVCLVTGVGILFNHTVEGNIPTDKNTVVSTKPAEAITAAALPAISAASVVPNMAITASNTEQPIPVNNSAAIATTTTTTPVITDTTAAPPVSTTAIATTAAGSDKPIETTVEVKAAPTEQPTNTSAQPEAEQAKTVTAEDNQKSGWLYAGQFTGGKWVEQALKIGAELPVAGQSYTIQWDSIVRQAPPGVGAKGGKNSKALANIAAGNKIDVLEVKPASTKGHIWLKIKQ